MPRIMENGCAKPWPRGALACLDKPGAPEPGLSENSGGFAADCCVAGPTKVSDKSQYGYMIDRSAVN